MLILSILSDIAAASNDNGKFLLAARKCRRPTCTDYIISLNAEDMSKGSSAYIGKLRQVLLIYDIYCFLTVF